MIVTVNEKEYRVRFRYGKQKDTSCQIVSGEMTIGVGLAVCSPKDQFCRARGRKIALARAIIQAFPRSERAAFWEAVFSARRNKKGLWGIIHPEMLEKQLEQTPDGDMLLIPTEAIEWVNDEQWKV